VTQDLEQDESMNAKPAPKKQSIQLSDCLDLFTTMETLGEHDPWYVLFFLTSFWFVNVIHIFFGHILSYEDVMNHAVHSILNFLCSVWQFLCLEAPLKLPDE
jgi:hypothetical protein